VLRAAAVTPLPQAPEIVLGALDLHGEIVPVIDLRKRFALPQRELRSSDQFLVTRTRGLRLALAVDGAETVCEAPAERALQPEKFLLGAPLVEAVARTEDGLVLIHDLESLLFRAEEELLARVLEGAHD
jgi:purine-binding chemotaxis protein CheW